MTLFHKSFYKKVLFSRYYYEKSTKCDLHSSKNLAKSLNELHVEPQLPSTIRPPSIFDLPQEFPLTRSVSTTTEIFKETTKPPSNQPNNKQLTAKKDNIRPKTSSSSNNSNNMKGKGLDICGLSRGLKKTKDELFNEFCKRAGMRPKPKNIYYIENEDGEDENGNQNENIFIVEKEAANIPPPKSAAKFRRNSLFYEPLSAAAATTGPAGQNTKQNSNLSLHSSFPVNNNVLNQDKVYPKSLFDLANCEQDMWNGNYITANVDPGYFNMYGSRTLPRSFARRNFYDSHDSLIHPYATLPMHGLQQQHQIFMHSR